MDRRIFVVGALALALIAAPVLAQTTSSAPEPQRVQLAQAAPRVAPSSQAQVQLSFAPVASRASPAVVSVSAQRVVRTRPGLSSDPFFGRFGAPSVQQSLGSGVIVRSDGVIVTNNHVVEGAQALRVVLGDRREFDAELLLADARTDLAVIRINTRGERLPNLEMADTRSLQVGDLVLAIGNPFGLSRTVTSGIISALARTEVGINDYAFFIQTDAAINRGNSGGALVDMQGRLVGINTAIYSESGGSNGIGFAIPAEMVRRVVDGAVSGGRRVVRPWVGARVQPVTQDIARSMGMDRPDGVLVADVYPGSSAARAGLQRGDVIISVGGAAVHDEAGVRYQFATQNPGSQIPLEIARGGQRRAISVAAEPAPGGSLQPRAMQGRNPLAGSQVATLTPSSSEEAGLDPLLPGVRIVSMSSSVYAARAGLRPGDIVREVNGQQIRSVEDLERAFAATNAWRLVIERGGRRAEIAFQM